MFLNQSFRNNTTCLVAKRDLKSTLSLFTIIHFTVYSFVCLCVCVISCDKKSSPFFLNCYFHRVIMNNTSDTTDSEEGEGMLSSSSYEVTLWCAVFIFTSITVLFGNTLAIAVFVGKKLLRKRSNILLLNLATADLLIGGVAIPMYICIFYKSHKADQWENRIFNEVYLCLDIFAGLSSMLLLVVIALERVYSIFFPFSHRCTSRQFYWLSAGSAWIIAGCVACLKLLFSRRVIPPSYDYYIIVTIVSLAILTMSASYVAIWTRLQCRRKNSSVIVQEKPIAMAMLIVTIAFLGMWLPIYFINLIGSFDSRSVLAIPLNAIYFAKLSQYCNSVVNPIVYSLKLPQFRKALDRRRHKSSVRTEHRTIGP